MVRQCTPSSGVTDGNSDLLVQYNCPDGEYEPLATMFMNTEGDAIRSIISGFESAGGIHDADWHLIIFAFTWWFWTITTYGVWVPAGLFLPGIIIGCAVGGSYAEPEDSVLRKSISDTYTNDSSATFVLVGAGAISVQYAIVSSAFSTDMIIM